MIKKVSSFDFLNNFDLILVRLGSFAESYPENDPHASLIRLRQYGEILSRHIAGKFNIYIESEEANFDVLENLKSVDQIPQEVISGLNQLRIVGNNALHSFQGGSTDVKKNIQTAINLGQWFVSISRSHGGNISLEEFIPHEIKQELKRVTLKNQPKKEIKKYYNDFSGKDLSRKLFNGQNLTDFDFSGADLRKTSFANANLKNTVFDGADIRGAIFLGSKNLQSYQLENALKDKNTKIPDNINCKFIIDDR
jgi:type I restriction enzyme R subunit